MEPTKNELELAGCIRRLLKSRALLKSRNQKWFQAILDHQKSLRSWFDQMYVRLEINEALGIIYLVPQDQEVEEKLNFQMGKKRTLSPMASLLILHLRNLRLQFYIQPSHQEIPLISIEELREFLQHFNIFKMDAQFERAFRRTVEELDELQILVETKPESGLFEITPLTEVLLPLEQIQEVHAKVENYFLSTTSVAESHNDGVHHA